MTRRMEHILGPRIPVDDWRARRARYLLPSVLLAAASVLLLISIFQPYWRMKLIAPQYPKGLYVHAYLNRLEGDVHEIDGLNHYIGMRPLEQAAQLERSLSIMMIVALSTLIGAAIFIHNRWAALLTLPAVAFPAGFLLDLYFWLHHFGTNLDPHAALSKAIKPFTPPVLGLGKIGQFKTLAVADTGLWLATAAAVLVLIGLYFHRRAYKPLVEARKQVQAERVHPEIGGSECAA